MERTIDQERGFMINIALWAKENAQFISECLDESDSEYKYIGMFNLILSSADNAQGYIHMTGEIPSNIDEVYDAAWSLDCIIQYNNDYVDYEYKLENYINL